MLKENHFYEGTDCRNWKAGFFFKTSGVSRLARSKSGMDIKRSSIEKGMLESSSSRNEPPRGLLGSSTMSFFILVITSGDTLSVPYLSSQY
eukprot:c20863_g3_i1 orf=1-270(-)